MMMKEIFIYIYAFLFLPAVISYSQDYSKLTLSEIMFRPEETSGEFIEIYNLSETDTLDLQQIKFKYYTSNPDSFLPLAGETKLPPGAYAVVLEANYDFENGIYKTLIPENAPVLKISDNAFGSSGMANTTGRPVYLIGPSDEILDEYTYSADNNAGISDEKIFISKENISGNWGNSTQKHGTPGSKNSISPLTFDLVLISFRFDKEFVINNEPAACEIKILNNGLETEDNYSIKVYFDANGDSLIQEDEDVFVISTSEIEPGDTALYQFSILSYPEGLNQYIASVEYPLDERLENNTAFAAFTYVIPNVDRYDIIINEFMYAPESPEPEWIEIYNNSNKIISIDGFKIADNASVERIVWGDLEILPGEFVVAAKDSAILSIHQIPSRLLIAPFPALNNSGDRIVLLDQYGRVIDSLEYQSNWGGSNGKSLERKIYNNPSFEKNNWGQSGDIKGGTPGRQNSISPKSFDVSIWRVGIQPSVVFENGSAEIIITINNLGLNAAGDFEVETYEDADNNLIFESGELIHSKEILNLDAGDSLTFSFDINEIQLRHYNFLSLVKYTLDQNGLNDSAYFSIAVQPEPQNFMDAVINEIMYKPSGDEPEWIEIFNNTSQNINVKNWRVADKTGSASIGDTNLILEPGAFITLSKDETIFDYYDITSTTVIVNLPSLNNSGDNLKLVDQYGNLIDSVNYKSTWGGADYGKSLEKIFSYQSGNDSVNWSSSVSESKATPGTKNSVVPKENDVFLFALTINPASAVVGSFVTINYSVINKGLGDQFFFLLNVYIDANGDSLAQDTELADKLNVTLQNPLKYREEFNGVYYFNKFNEGTNQLIFEVVIDAEDEFAQDNFAFAAVTGVVLNEMRGDLAINEFMYAPKTPEPEWIELYNASQKTIDLSGYSIADNSDTMGVIIGRLFLLPGNYLVIAKDSMFFSKYNIYENIVIAKFPLLNNTSDEIKILDSLNRVIDSLNYKSSWGGGSGRSLERIAAENASVDSANWAVSKNDAGATPGSVNSVSRKEHDLMLAGISFAPSAPVYGGNLSISVSVKNIGKNEATFNLILYEDSNYDSSGFIKIMEDENIFLFAGDSLEYTFAQPYANLDKPTGFLVSARFELDLDTSNNKIYASIAPGYKQGSVVINEIMYAPINGEPEWVELYNASGHTIEFINWKIGDVLNAPSFKPITNSSLQINSEEFLIVTKDSSIFSYHQAINSGVIVVPFANLNNDIDGIVLKDAAGNTIDSVLYNNSWGGQNGYSLERVLHVSPSTERSNWNSSTDIELSTPGRLNSITPKNYDLKLTAILIHPAHPVEGDEISAAALIKNIGVSPAENFSVQFQLVSGTDSVLISDILGNYMEAGDSVLIDAGSPFVIQDSARVKCLINYAGDENLFNNFAELRIYSGYPNGTIVINEFMNNPESGAEWIELFNNSNSAVSLKDWQISDVLTVPSKMKITSENFIVTPGEYFIVANDTLLNKPGDIKIFYCKFGTLGNTEDGIILYDFRDGIIDSAFYDNSWFMEKGFSVERIGFPDILRETSRWHISVDSSKSTMGKENSVNSLMNYPAGSVKINEIMYEPAPDNSEFIEIINASNEPVNIGGWKVFDESNKMFFLSCLNHYLFPGDYFLLSADSTIFNNYSGLPQNKSIRVNRSSDLSLSNTSESIVIADAFGNVIDSVKYFSDWHNKNIPFVKNKSLERINPFIESNQKSNWSTSVNQNGATPGGENSIYTAKGKTRSRLTIEPNPFSPDNDGYQDFAIISYNLKSETAQIRLKIFDDKGRLVRTVANNEASGSSGSVIFDGLDESGKPLRIGMYIVFLEAAGLGSGMVESIKKVLVVARRF